MRLLTISTVLRCEGCHTDGARVKMSVAGKPDRSECPKWRRAWNRKLRKLKDAGWSIHRNKRGYYGFCPDCWTIVVARGFVPCDDATCILMKNHPGRHANANGARWGEDRGRVAEPGLAPIRKMGGFKEVS
jgi:hypothetical protein